MTQREMTLEEYIGQLPDMHRAHKEYVAMRADLELKDDALRTALGELEGIWSFYGTGLTVNNWHLNGDEEPWDTFFEESSQDAISEIKQALTKPEEESNDDDKNT